MSIQTQTARRTCAKPLAGMYLVEAGLYLVARNPGLTDKQPDCGVFGPGNSDAGLPETDGDYWVHYK